MVWYDGMRFSPFVAAVVIIAACVGDDPTPNTNGDAGVDAMSANDSGPTAPCNLAAPFGAPTSLASLNTVNGEGHPTLTADELLVFYVVGVSASDLRLKFATRAKKEDAFGGAQEATELNDGGQYNAGPWINAEGTQILFSSAFREGINASDIWESTRASRSSPWGKPVRLGLPSNLNASTSNEEEPFRAADGLWFASNRNTTDLDIYFARDVGGVLQSAVPRDELNSGSGDWAPSLTRDALRIYFASMRPNGGKGSWDIWTASRATTDDNFASLTNVEELNTSSADTPRWISPDGCRIYFSSDRKDIGAGAGDLYFAAKP